MSRLSSTNWRLFCIVALLLLLACPSLCSKCDSSQGACPFGFNGNGQPKDDHTLTDIDNVDAPGYSGMDSLAIPPYPELPKNWLSWSGWSDFFNEVWVFIVDLFFALVNYLSDLLAQLLNYVANWLANPQNNDLSTWILVIGAVIIITVICVVLILLLIVLLIVICCSICCCVIIFKCVKCCKKVGKSNRDDDSSTEMVNVVPFDPTLTSRAEKKMAVEPTAMDDHANAVIEGASFISLEECSNFHQVGSGAYGVVYRANFRGAEVAVKVLEIDAQQHGEAFLQEAMTMAQLRHPRLLQFVGIVNENGKLGIVTEFMERGTLDQWLWRKPNPNMSLTWQQKMGILKDVAAGMSFIHSRDVIHRDLKSPNILLGSDFRAKIGDFGLARVVDEAQSRMTSNQGTPLWMAPEVVGGTGVYDNKCDVFSFGIIMWEVLIEKEPYYNVPNKMGVAVNVFNNPNFRPQVPTLQEVIPLHNTQEEKSSIAFVFEPFITLMRTCWFHDPTSRPSFDQVVEQFILMTTTF